ncbi:hypothetical protein HQ585_04430 [candidate division KSB1 bacterium]|nr:hypothetical protein [candidate division KSB1 bacterium]
MRDKGIQKQSILLGLCVLLLFSDGTARDRLLRSEADSLIARGNELLSWGRSEQALHPFKKVLDTFPNDVDARFGRAEAHFALHQWGDASDWYGNVLDKDPNRIEAHYGKAVAKREIGKHSVLVQRYLIWRSSRIHFEKAAALDSTFRDLLFQWALLERYGGQYKKAILLTHRQTRILLNEKIKLGLLMMYDFYVEHTDKDEAETWLESRHTPYDRLALGEFYRREEMFLKADSMFQSLLDSPGWIPLEAVHLSMVRLAVQTDQPELAEFHYWQAVDRVRNLVGVELILQDFMTIINENEYHAFANQVTLSNFTSTIRSFWNTRNPLPASETNLRLVEHFRRTLYAEKYYRYDGFRHKVYTTDMSVTFDFPVWRTENYKFNDMGLIYIRYGKPDEQSFAVSENVTENMSWLYYSRGNQPKMIFHFAVQNNAPPGLWTLVSGFDQPEILEGLLHWDRLYQEMLFSTGTERLARWHELTTQRAEMVRIGMRSDRHTWIDETEVLEMYQTASRFRQSKSEDVLQIAYAVPVMFNLNDDSGHHAIHLESGLAVFDQGMSPIFKRVQNDTISDSTDIRIFHGYFIEEYEVPVQLQMVNVAIHARIPDQNKVNAWKYQYALSSENRDALSLSSLILAYDIAPKSNPAARHRNDLKMIPNPSGKFKSNDPVYAYYELYNLAYDKDGKTRYEVDFALCRDPRNKSVFRKLFGWIGGGGGYKISLQSEQRSEFRTVSDYLSFDLTQADPGEYELKLIVKDLVLNEKVEAIALFELVE